MAPSPWLTTSYSINPAPGLSNPKNCITPYKITIYRKFLDPPTSVVGVLFRTICSGQLGLFVHAGVAGDWLRFAHLPASHAPAGQIGFVLHISSYAGRGPGVPPQVCPQSPIRNRDTASVPRFGQLALFCGGPLHVQFAINPFPSSTCPSCRCGVIGFVSHECSPRRQGGHGE